MSKATFHFDYAFWCSQVAPMRGRGPETQRELLTHLAFWSIRCAPETAIQRIITANNCYSRGDRPPVSSRSIARAYGELRDGDRLPRNSKREAFARALAGHASEGWLATPLYDPPSGIDPREGRGTGQRGAEG